MTDTTPNLPARPEFDTGTRNIPLGEASTPALAFALGYAAARPQSAAQFAPFCAMVEELAKRVTALGRDEPGVTLGAWDQRTELGALMAMLPGQMASQIQMLYQAQRGQRWAATGHRDGRPPR